MPKVCQKEFPAGSFRYQKDDGFHMHDLLKLQLDYFIKNVTDDWDFTVVVSGKGGVRVGKSVLAQQIAMYWTSELRKKGYNLPFSVEENIVFDGQKLIERGNDLGQRHPYSALIFDEAGADLEGAKAMKNTTRAVKDYLRECGQYNMLTILVIPEYFDLPKGIAINRAACLIDVYSTSDDEGNFRRGLFRFFNKPRKKQLYLQGKRNLDYDASTPNFHGTFPKFIPINEDKYKKEKKEALKKREDNTQDKKVIQRNVAWHLLVNEAGMSRTEIARRTTNMGAYTPNQTISEALKGINFFEEGSE